MENVPSPLLNLAMENCVAVSLVPSRKMSLSSPGFLSRRRTKSEAGMLSYTALEGSMSSCDVGADGTGDDLVAVLRNDSFKDP